VLSRRNLLDQIGRENVFETKDEAIRGIYARLDTERCRVCTARIFAECQTILPDGSRRTDVPAGRWQNHEPSIWQRGDSRD